MQILAKIFFTIFLLISTSFIQAETCSMPISSADIGIIVQSLDQKINILKDGGFFFDEKIEDVVTKEYLYNKIKENGALYIFPNEESYSLFIQYLRKIQSAPCLYINKETKYNTPDKQYVFILTSNDRQITIQFTVQGTYIEGFGMPETSYIYSFGKFDSGKVELLEINIAG